MKVAVVGTGYVGLVSGACLADLGHDVTCIDTDASKVERLSAGVMPIFESGLEELVRRNAQAGRLRFTTSFADGVPGAEVVSIAVGTPSAPDGSVDMRYVDAAAAEIGRHLTGYAVIATKSTVPVGTSERIGRILSENTKRPFDVVSNPEFLREGRAVFDFLHPARIVIGSSTPRAADVMLRLYATLDCPKVVMDPKSAELAKYAANAFLATKISFINEIAHLCEAVGADVESVAHAVGLDPRIGKEFLRAGIGWGGSCFPKDVLALRGLGRTVGQPLSVVDAAIETNRRARSRIADRLDEALGGVSGRGIAVFGVAFKGNTDDTRESPAADLVRTLARRGAAVAVYDPVARFPSDGSIVVRQTESLYDAASGVEAVVVATEWEEFRNVDLPRLKSVMSGSVLFDARNLLDPDAATRAGFRYFRVGRQPPQMC